MKKPKVFIASPLFNGPQIAVIQRIEDLLSGQGFDYYSARLHSGSAGMTPEQRKDPKAWEPVMESNLRGLDECSMMIAVVEYALPGEFETGTLSLVTGDYWTPDPSIFKSCGVGKPKGIRGYGTPYRFTPLELPDAGTVWEMGYHTAQGKSVVAFHSQKAPGHLNLMLSHSVVGILSGWENLEAFLRPNPLSVSVQGGPQADRVYDEINRKVQAAYQAACLPWFDWTQIYRWNSEVE